jgi:hypothetical protein
VEHEDLDAVGPELRQARVEVGGDVGWGDAAKQRAAALRGAVVVAGLGDDRDVVPAVSQAGPEDSFALPVGARGVEEVPAQVEPGVGQRPGEVELVVRPPGGPERQPGEVAAERGEALRG